MSPDEVHTAWIAALRAQDTTRAIALFTTEKRPYPGGPGYAGNISDAVTYHMKNTARLEQGWTSDDTFTGVPIDHVTIQPVTPGRWTYLREGRSNWWFNKDERGEAFCGYTVLLETPQGWKVASWRAGACSYTT